MMTANDTFFANDAADTHCMQACYQMLVARLSGKRLTSEQAEIETGYGPGLLTWQFAMLLSLADRYGFYVRDHEAFEPEKFVADPIQSIREQIVDEDAVQHQVQNTDLPAEVERASACLEHRRIEFLTDAPDFDLLTRLRAKDVQLICLINGAVIDGRDGYRPHFVVVKAIDEANVIIDDPGPPARPDMVVPRDTFIRAWTDPSPSVANYLAASLEPFTER